MKESLKRFYEYCDTDEDLATYVRFYGWNEESFCEMRKLVKEVMKDYAKEDDYPKGFVHYFMLDIPVVIDILSIIKDSTETPRGYTQESYVNMLSERMRLLDELCQEFIDSCKNF